MTPFDGATNISRLRHEDDPLPVEFLERDVLGVDVFLGGEEG
ncbi:MAG: hypothetical protein JWO37_349 [Acidimicrobiales bacterium]|jgi:hypothetical protein|nr:hypothetical protein [Acidimicrobiales bacterium]